MLFSVLAVLTLFMLLLVGHAHAASATSGTGPTGFFTTPDPANDLAQNWINFLFKDQPLPNYADQNGVVITQYTDVQQALVTTLAFYSNAILILAAIILFYHLVSMVVETAHHGVVMGKRASQIWAPIRLVVAIGLLVPVERRRIKLRQYVVIQVAEWGSGLASQVWNRFVVARNFAYVAPPIPNLHDEAQSIVFINACEYIVNAHVQLAANANNTPLPDDIITPADGR